MGCRSNGLSELWAVGIMLRFPTSLPQSDIDHNIQPATTYHVISDDDDFQLTTSNQNLSTVPTADSDDEFQPVNTSVAVKSRTSTPENSNNGAFLDSDIIIDIVPNASETSIPRGKKENQYFVIDNDIGASDSSVQAVINDTDNSEKTRPTKKSEKRQNHDHYIMIHATVE